LAVLFVAGWLSDRIGDRRALVLCLTTTGVLTLCLGLFPGPTLTPAFIFLQAAASVLFFPPAFAAVSRIAPAQMRNLAISLTTAVGVILGGGGCLQGSAIWPRSPHSPSPSLCSVRWCSSPPSCFGWAPYLKPSIAVEPQRAQSAQRKTLCSGFGMPPGQARAGKLSRAPRLRTLKSGTSLRSLRVWR
jgi:MFS family permease